MTVANLHHCLQVSYLTPILLTFITSLSTSHARAHTHTHTQDKNKDDCVFTPSILSPFSNYIKFSFLLNTADFSSLSHTILMVPPTSHSHLLWSWRGCQPCSPPPPLSVIWGRHMARKSQAENSSGLIYQH